MDVTKAKSIADKVYLSRDHFQYLGLPVIFSSIDQPGTLSTSQNDSRFRINMRYRNEVKVLSMDSTLERHQPRDYITSAIKLLKRYGRLPEIEYDLKISDKVPVNNCYLFLHLDSVFLGFVKIKDGSMVHSY